MTKYLVWHPAKPQLDAEFIGAFEAEDKDALYRLLNADDRPLSIEVCSMSIGDFIVEEQDGKSALVVVRCGWIERQWSYEHVLKPEERTKWFRQRLIDIRNEARRIEQYLGNEPLNRFP